MVGWDRGPRDMLIDICCDLLSADCLSDQRGSLVRDGSHHVQLNPQEKRTAVVVIMSGSIAALDARVRPPMA